MYLQAKTVRVKPFGIFKPLCLGITILKVPYLSAILKWLETIDLPHHVPKCQYVFAWYVKTVRHAFDL